MILVISIVSYFYFKPKEETIPSGKFKTDISFISTKLATIPDKYKLFPQYVDFSPVGRSVAYVVSDGEKQIMIIGSNESKRYDFVGYQNYSYDGKLIGYVAINGDASQAVISNQENPKNDLVYSGKSISFAPNSYKVIYKEADGRKVRYVIDGSKGNYYDSVDDLIFSPDGKKFAYKAVKFGYYGGESGGTKVVSGIVEGGHYSEDQSYIGVESIKFSPDSKNLYYEAYRETEYPQQESTIVINGNEGKWYTSINGFVVGKDNKLGFIAKQGNESFLVTNGIEGERFYEKRSAYSAIGSLTASLDGQTIGYEVNKQENRGAYYVIGDKKEKEYEAVQGLTFSPDGKNYAYIAYQNKKYFAVVNGKESLSRSDLIAQIYMGEENKIVYRARKEGTNKYFVTINNVDGPTYDNVTAISFSPKTNRVIYIGRRDKKSFLVIDGVEKTSYDWIDDKLLKFNGDGQKVAFGVKSGNELWWIAEDI